MANKNKQKGSYHERWFVEWFKAASIVAKRQPLSGSLGGEYSGDLKVTIDGHELVAEVKYRDTSGFPSPFKVLENRDFALYKRRRGTPQVLVILPGDLFLKLMENKHEHSESTGLGASEAGENPDSD